VAITGTAQGQLQNIPHRVAEALRADGWVWRQTIVWAKRCLSGGTWLYARTAKGDAPAMLKDLVRLDPATVKLWDGAKWTQVLGWTRTPTERGNRRANKARQYLELVLRSGERIGCTATHRWPTQRGVVYSSDLVIGDVLDTCRLPEPPPVPPLCLDEADFGWLCGFYLAEGCKTEKGVAFAIHAKETAAYQRIKAIAESLGGTASMQKRVGNAAAAVVYSKAMRELLADFVPGTTCRNKRLGRKAWARGDTFLAALLAGYLEGDGHWRQDAGQWILGFCNNDGLATDLRCLSARLGKVCVLRRVTHSCNGKKYPGWRGRIREKSSHHNAEPMSKIVAIENSRAREFWDIAVADEPNLFSLASGVLSHNSPMPESVGGWRWSRCRVKVAGQQRDKASKIGGNVAEMRISPPHPDNGIKTVAATYSDCPGCPKCEPNGGYVLRRGAGRCTTAHEYVFVMAKGPRYFWDSEASKEAALQPKGVARETGQHKTYDLGQAGSGSLGTNQGSSHRNPRSVWTISSEPTRERHFASYPSELVRRCLVAGISAGGCCPECGAPFAPVVESERVATRPGIDPKAGGAEANRDPARHVTTTRANGYRPTCTCGRTDSTGCLVLDPFSGIGTTGQTALELGARFTGIDLNPEYHAVACRRILETPRWKLRLSKPKPKPRPASTDAPLFALEAQP
jgi:hypothetical protein